MANRKRLELEIVGDAKGGVRAFAEIGDAADRSDSRLSRFGSKVGSMFSGLGVAVAGFGLAAGAGLGLFGFSAIQSASDSNEAISKVGVVFGDQAAEIEAFADTAATSLGMSETAALSAAGTYGNLFRAMGIGTDAAADMSTSLVGLAADLASFNNANPEEVLEALRSGLTGETEPLRRFGVNINQARLEAEALNLGLAQGNVSLAAVQQKTIALEKAQAKAAQTMREHGAGSLEFRDAQADVASAQEALDKALAGGAVKLDDAAKAQAAYSLIMKDTALAQGDFSRTSDGLANQQRIVSAQFEDLKASLGTAFLPMAVELGGVLTGTVMPALEGLVPHVETAARWLGENLPVGLDRLRQIWDQVGPQLISVGTEIGTKLSPIFETLGSVVSSLGGMFSGGLGEGGASGTLGKLRDAGQSLWDALSSIFDLIGQLLGNVRDAWNEHGDTIMGYVQGFVDGILGLFGGLFDAIRGIVETVGALLRGDWEAVWTGLQTIVFGVLDAIRGICEAAMNGLLAIVTGLGALLQQVFGGLWQSIVDGATAAWDWVYSKVEGVIGAVIGFGQGLWNAYAAVWSGILNAAIGVWDWIWAKVESVVGFVVGLGQGIVGAYLTVWTTIRDGAAAAFAWVWEKAEALLGFFTSLPGRMWEAVRGLFTGIAQAFANALNWVIDKWNGLELSLPSVDTPFGTIGGFTLGTPDLPTFPLPSFHTGGTYRAPRPGGEGFALLRDGERVSTPGGGYSERGGGVTIENLSISVDGAGGDARRLARELVDELVRELGKREIRLT